MSVPPASAAHSLTPYLRHSFAPAACGRPPAGAPSRHPFSYLGLTARVSPPVGHGRFGLLSLTAVHSCLVSSLRSFASSSLTVCLSVGHLRSVPPSIPFLIPFGSLVSLCRSFVPPCSTRTEPDETRRGEWKRKSLVTAGKNWTMMVIICLASYRSLLPSCRAAVPLSLQGPAYGGRRVRAR